MNPIPLAGPAVEPISVDEMKAYLRLDGSTEDELVAALVVAGFAVTLMAGQTFHPPRDVVRVILGEQVPYS